jgi:hypothetical protein
VTDHVDHIPDTGPLNFKLWLPRWDSRNGRLRCRFQASTVGLTQLNEGTSECMTRFLTELGQAEAKNIIWSSRRYRTTYFSDFPDADGWQDRLAMTWAVEIETDSDVDPEDAGTHAPGPHGSHAHDTTFEDDDEDWEPTREHVLIIAGKAYGAEVDTTPLESVEGVLSADTGIFEGMVTLDLGKLDFPEGVQRIDAVLARCREQDLRTNWKDPDTVNPASIRSTIFKASII